MSKLSLYWDYNKITVDGIGSMLSYNFRKIKELGLGKKKSLVQMETTLAVTALNCSLKHSFQN